MGYWGQRLDQVHKSESSRHTERSLHRILRCFAIHLAEDFCLFIKRIHLHLHKLGLNFDHFLEIFGLAESLHCLRFIDHRQCFSHIRLTNSKLARNSRWCDTRFESGADRVQLSRVREEGTSTCR